MKELSFKQAEGQTMEVVHRYILENLRNSRDATYTYTQTQANFGFELV